MAQHNYMATTICWPRFWPTCKNVGCPWYTWSDILVYTKDPQVVADTFNTFFSEQIVKLQSNIDDNLKEDPVEKLKTNSKLNKKKFSIKTITEETTFKTICSPLVNIIFSQLSF